MSAALQMCVNPSAHYVVGATAQRRGGSYRYHVPTAQWQHWGADDPSLTGLAIDLDDPDLVYTSGQNGIWRSADAGRSWRITNDWRISDARAVVIDPTRGSDVYAALPDGVVLSEDRGATWSRREEGLPVRGRYTQSIAVDRRRAGHVIAACESGLYVTHDSARTWWRALATSATATQVVQAHDEPDLWFATTERDGLWRSTDDGTTWRPSPLPDARTLLDVATSVTGATVAVVDSERGVWCSDDHGEHWRLASDGLPSPARAQRIGIEPTTSLLVLATASHGLFASSDAGERWEPAGMAGADVRSFVVTGALP